MKVMVIAVVIGIVPKNMGKRLVELETKERIEAPVLRSARILRRVLENYGDLLSVRLQ